jgi:hypothetical protein
VLTVSDRTNRCYWNCFGLLAAAWLACTAGCEQNQSPGGRAHVRAHGLWYTSLEEIGRTTPTGAGDTAWAWSASGLSVIDHVGKSLRKIPIPVDAWKVDSLNFDVHVWPTPGGSQAWVGLKNGKVFLVDTTGAVREISGPTMPRDTSHGPDWDRSIDMAPNGKAVWVPEEFGQNLMVFRGDGAGAYVKLPEMPGFSRRVFSHPAADSVHLWSGAQINAGDKRASRYAWLFLVDDRGRAEDVVSRIHASIDASRGVFFAAGKYWCVPSRPTGAYCIVQDGTLLNSGRPLGPPVAIRHLAAEQDSATVWFVPEGKGLWRFRPDQDSAPISVLDDFHFTRLITLRHAVLAVGPVASFLIGDDDRPVRLPSHSLLPSVTQGLSSNDGARHFVLSGHNLLVISANGKLENGGEPLVRDLQELPKKTSFSDDIEADRPLSDVVTPFSSGSVFVRKKNGVVIVRRADDGSYVRTELEDRFKRFRAASSKGRFLWLRDEGEIAVVREDGVLFFRNLQRRGAVDFGAPSPCSDGKHAWTAGGWVLGGSWVVGLVDSPSDLLKAAISFDTGLGARDLSAHNAPPQSPVLSVDPTQGSWRYELNWLGKLADAGVGSAEANIIKDAISISKAAFAGDTPATPQKRTELAFDVPYEVRLDYIDGSGSHVRVAWTDIVFRVPWYKRREAITVWVALAICALAWILIRLRARVPVAGSWWPLLLWGGGGLSSFLPQGVAQIGANPTLLLGLLATAFVIAAVAGAFSASVFRDLAGVEPFRRIAPLLLTLAPVRRRLYASYLESLTRRVADDRKRAYDESYIQLPALIKGGTPRTEEITAAPARDILARLESGKSRLVLISAPGGRGKSALIREVLSGWIARCAANPALPLPVLCRWSDDSAADPAKTLEGMVGRGLNTALFVPEALGSQLQTGGYMVVIDGLTEQDITTRILDTWLSTPYGERTIFLLTTRPEQGFSDVVASRADALEVAPSRLDDSTIDAFEGGYVATDSQIPGRTPARLTDTLRRACRTSDGTYLPILVRFAVGLGPSARTIRDVYELTVGGLLKRDNGEPDPVLIAKAGELCLETYWRTGSRTLPFDSGSPARNELLETLWQAGLVIAADQSAHAFRQRPSHVRFFHDSIQSFLTARALEQRYRDEEDWRVLEEAAGSPKFVKAQAEIVSQRGSEVFQFCVQQFASDRLGRVLAQHLREWATRYERDFRKSDVLSSVSDTLRPALEMRIQLEDSPMRTLQSAIDLLEEQRAHTTFELAGLYAGLAPVLWPYLQRDRVSAGLTRTA